MADTKTKSLGGNLYLCEKPLAGGGTSSYYAYRAPKDASGRRAWKKIEDRNKISITDARKLASKRTVKIKFEGIDPRMEVGEAPDFLSYATAKIDELCVGHSEKEKASWQRSIRDVPSLHKLPVSIIGLTHVRDALKPFWRPKEEGGKPVSALNIRQRLKNIFAAAKAEGYRRGLDNPADWREGLKSLMAPMKRIHKKTGRRSVPYAELPKMMKLLRYVDTRVARCVEFTVLTCSRSQEARNAAWADINLTDRPITIRGRSVPPRTWSLPAGLMKMGRDHFVPLNDEAVDILLAMQGETGSGSLVFPSDHMLAHVPFQANALVRTIAEETGYDVHMHGCRTTFRTWGGDSPAGYHRDVLEFCIAHVEGEEAELAYWQGDMIERRRVVMDAWGKYAMSNIPAPKRRLATDTPTGANVVKLKRRAA